jgi:hypothetical protein
VRRIIDSFASGVARDEATIRAAITSCWSNGQTEGQITRLELLRRQMCRGKIDLLKPDRGIGAAPKLRQSQFWTDDVIAVSAYGAKAPYRRVFAINRSEDLS